MKLMLVLLMLLSTNAFSGDCSDKDLRKGLSQINKVVIYAENCADKGECTSFKSWLDGDRALVAETIRCVEEPESKLERQVHNSAKRLVIGMFKVLVILNN
jgi:hypothetical protein